jgi:hypothetical protein
MNRYFQLFFIGLISFSLCHAQELKKDFFLNPETVSIEEVLEALDSKSLNMSWQIGENDFFYFVSKKDAVYFEILFDRIPAAYEDLKDFFIEEQCEINGVERPVFTFSCDWKPGENPILNHPQKHEKVQGAHTALYCVEERRFFEHPNPQPMTEIELAEIISNRNILFYTGAGISVASGIPSMKQLYELLGLNTGVKFIPTQAFEDPKAFAEKILQFHNACLYSQPTAAHYALKELALSKNIKIVTENLDCLHEYSGILPYRVNAQELRDEVDSTQLKDIEFIICIGLSYDDKGFLGWYKKHNPNGIIISIDIGNPSYLGHEDFILHQDLQSLLKGLRPPKNPCHLRDSVP